MNKSSSPRINKKEITQSSPIIIHVNPDHTPQTRKRFQTLDNANLTPSPAHSPENTKKTDMREFERRLSDASPRKDDSLTLIEVIAQVFQLEENNWKPTEGTSRIAIIDQSEDKYRVLALSGNQQYTINTWIRGDRSCKMSSETFCSFSAVVNRVNIVYGLRFKSAEDTTNFCAIFAECVQKSKDKENAPKEESKLKESFQL